MRILWCSDGVTPTGFSRVAHSVIEHFPENWEIHHLAINYKGDPHNYKHRIYPASTNMYQDVWGISRLQEFSNMNFDLIFIFNDLWVIDWYLENIKQTFKKVPPIIIYFPVDAEGYDASWFRHKDIVSCFVTYTEFGRKTVEPFIDDKPLEVIPHGNGKNVFYQIYENRSDAKKEIFKKFPELVDSYIILNANRNQPRKRLDLSLEGFALFAENKPENVLYYHHAGMKDAGWDIDKLVLRYGLTNRFIVTNREAQNQKVSIEKLNLIYNATDVGLNTSLGEGWGLTASEHAATGAPQVVPDHSACRELFEGCGLLIPTSGKHTYEQTLTIGRLVSPEDVAEQLDIIYNDKELYELLARAGKEKFTSDTYSWETVSKQFKKLFIKYGNNLA